MRRNMIEANRGLFSRLAAAGGDRISRDLQLQKRAVRTDAAEKGWLRDLSIRTSAHLVVDSASRFAIGEYQEALYLIAVGVEVAGPSSELTSVALNAGMFTAIAQELEVPIIRTADLAERLLEYVFYPVEQDCEMFELEVVAPFFQKISVYRVERGSALASDRMFGMRAAIAAVLGAPQLRSLAWPQSALDRFSIMVRDPSERSPFHLLFRALTETRDEGAFLALYRCVEQLFPIPAIAELSADLNLARPALGVAALIEKHLGWRRREEDAIAALFSELDGALIDRMLPAVGAVALSGARSRSVAKRIYDLRNQCVHFRPAHAIGEGVSVDNWSTLNDQLLEVVQCLYARYAAAFDVPEGAGA